MLVGAGGGEAGEDVVVKGGRHDNAPAPLILKVFEALVIPAVTLAEQAVRCRVVSSSVTPDWSVFDAFTRPNESWSWAAVDEWTAAFDRQLDATRARVARLRKASDKVLSDLGGDPTRTDWTTFRPLRREREEDWSDWLAQFIEDSEHGWFSWSLLGAGGAATERLLSCEGQEGSGLRKVQGRCDCGLERRLVHARRGQGGRSGAGQDARDGSQDGVAPHGAAPPIGRHPDMPSAAQRLVVGLSGGGGHGRAGSRPSRGWMSRARRGLHCGQGEASRCAGGCGRMRSAARSNRICSACARDWMPRRGQKASQYNRWAGLRSCWPRNGESRD